MFKSNADADQIFALSSGPKLFVAVVRRGG
jgi:hypothetical protein